MKTYEILIDDIGTEKYIEADTENKALKVAREMEQNGECLNYMGQVHGRVTVDEQTPKELIQRLKDIREQHGAETLRATEQIKAKDQEISSLRSAVVGRDIDKKLLREQLNTARSQFNERHNAVVRREEIIEGLNRENEELRDKLNEMKKIENAIKVLKGIL